MKFDLTKEQELDLIARGAKVTHVNEAALTGSPSKEADVEPGERKMVERSVEVVDGKFIAVLPVITRSEANESSWHRKMHRKLSGKAACRQILGPHLRLLVPFAEAYHA